MASSIMHMAISSILEKRIDIKDINRFRIGQILPDAIIKEDKDHENTHFTKICKENKRTMDFSEFYRMFNNEISYDDLYLGYYFHLIQDDIFRMFLYYDLDCLKLRKNKEFVDTLHMDYKITNKKLISRYKLKNNLMIPIDFYEERINEIYTFDINDFIDEFKNYFQCNYEGNPVYFTDKNIEDYIYKCVKSCELEFKFIKKCNHYLKVSDFLWDIV